MTTVKLAPAKAAGHSTTTTVGSSETKVLSIYTDSGVPVPIGVDMKLQRKTAADFWQDVYAPDFGKVVFTANLLNVSISSIGDYRVLREDITTYGVNVGVSED